MNTADTEYAVHANAYPNRHFKKIRVAQLYVINGDGELIFDVTGDCTIVLYEGRMNRNKVKEAVKSYGVRI